MRSYDLYFTFYSDRTDVRYFVDVVQQPWYRVLIANVYHWYDMRIVKVPGFKTIERWHSKRFRRGLTYVPLGARQDQRCYFLKKQDKQVIATFEVDRATYLRLGGPESTPENNN